ncbi:MAG: murein biosynthesis integral membrane protein MurJ [Oscillospiraceae bacterium]|jgi:putative peptidoglycan lipid II flippase|nr:murein biosynthesis integral membrane protein MurJ [Oscillospiraceae bacterium]
MNNLLRSSVFVSLAYLLLRLGGFLRESVLAYAFGAGVTSDAFVIAYTIPNLILSFLVGAAATTYISVHASLASDNRRRRFINNLLTAFALIGAVLAALFFAMPQVFVAMLASRAAPDTVAIASTLLRYMGWAAIPMLLACILSANLQTHGRFFIATAYQIFNNIFIIVGIFLAKSTSFLPWMGVGMTLGNLLSFAVLLVGSKNTGLRYKPRLDWSSPTLRRFFVLLAPIMLSTLVVEINQIVDRNVATSLGEGVVSTLNYAMKVKDVFTAFIGMAIGTAVFPNMSKLAATGDIEGLKEQVGASIKFLLPLLLPLTLGMALLAEPIIRILLERGAFEPEDTVRTAACLRFFTLSMFAANVNQMLTRAFYARQKTRLPAMIAAASVILNIGLIFIFVKDLSYLGLALATSVSGMASMLAYYICLRREIGSIRIFAKFSEWLKLGAALAAMSVFVWVGADMLQITEVSYNKCLVYLVGLVGGAALIYAAFLFGLYSEVAGDALAFLKRRRNGVSA